MRYIGRNRVVQSEYTGPPSLASYEECIYPILNFQIFSGHSTNCRCIFSELFVPTKFFTAESVAIVSNLLLHSLLLAKSQFILK